MLLATFAEGEWRDVEIVPYAQLKLSPATSALHYGLSVFEGLKAYRTVTDELVLFRPQMHWERLNRSCRRVVLPEVPEALFMEGLTELVRLDRDWVPGLDQGSLYVRPLVFASEETLRVKPATSCRFVILTGPVGGYFSEALTLVTTREYARAFPGGTGDIKLGGNYGASMIAEKAAQAKGYGTVLWLDAQEHLYVEECGVMNVFFVIAGKVVTPNLSGTILPGVTRDSVIAILSRLGLIVEERPITITELVAAHAAGQLSECFGTGTAAAVAHVGSITHEGRQLSLPPVERREVASATLERLSAIRAGRHPAPEDWLVPI
jgi:branched-chain amino acid aminotransferase